jgi:hypothetical protein
VYGQQGRDAEALDSAQLALRLFQGGGDRVGQAIALTDVVWYRRAYQAHTWSCLGDIEQHLGGRYGEASVLGVLGELHHAAGDPGASRRARQRAQDILGELDPAAAEQIRARLQGFEQPAAAETRD